uniref:Uncharacterized protein n=1 Tax=Arundo donax TaxID=35708 RepID=A0A0A9AH68_ARUDO
MCLIRFGHFSQWSLLRNLAMAHTFFWTDRWIHGQCIADLASRLYAAIPKQRVQRRTVQEAVTNRAWVSDIQGALTVGVIVDYLHLWDSL